MRTYMAVINQFVYAGRLDLLKGVDIMLQAWRILGNDAPCLQICGTGPLETYCSDFIKNNNLENKIFLKGFVSNLLTKEIIANSKAVIFPTLCYEGFPMVIAEAYSVGTPVIGSDIGNTAILIENCTTGLLFKNSDPFSLAHAIKNLPVIPRESIKKIYESKYSAKVNYTILEQIYDKVLKFSNV